MVFENEVGHCVLLEWCFLARVHSKNAASYTWSIIHMLAFTKKNLLLCTFCTLEWFISSFFTVKILDLKDNLQSWKSHVSIGIRVCIRNRYPTFAHFHPSQKRKIPYLALFFGFLLLSTGLTITPDPFSDNLPIGFQLFCKENSLL